MDCRLNGRFQGWACKPGNEKKARRKNQHKNLLACFGRGFCEVCNVNAQSRSSELELDAHHVVEHRHGGTSMRGNIWIVCKPCHKFIHSRRALARLGKTWLPEHRRDRMSYCSVCMKSENEPREDFTVYMDQYSICRPCLAEIHLLRQRIEFKNSCIL
jgi:hypothetical protein